MPPLVVKDARLKQEELSFLLDSYDPNVLAELALEEHRYLDMIAKINLRSDILRQHAYPHMYKAGIRHGQKLVLEELRKIVPEPVLADCQALGEFLLIYVERNLRSMERTYRKLHAILQLEFPWRRRGFIYFSFGKPIKRLSWHHRYKRWRLKARLAHNKRRLSQS